MADIPTTAGDRPLPRRPFFQLYKPGQGYYTRSGTAVGAAAIILAGAHFLHQRLIFQSDAPWTSWVRIGIPLAFVVGLGLLTWWLVGVHRPSCDFMIHTEGEMKKVSWSSRRELIGSTKVVILFTVLLGVILFGVDLLFMSFFGAIGVLKGPSLVQSLFGG
jgi:preprotein translocase SecE subunit